MSRQKEPDHFDWFGALQRASEDVRQLRPGPTLAPVAKCLCGSTDIRGNVLFQPIDLTASDVDAKPNEGQRPCQGCQHGIPHGAMCVVRYYGETTTVRDYYHPDCVVI